MLAKPVGHAFRSWEHSEDNLIFETNLQVAHQLGKKRLRSYSHRFSPKKFTLPQLFACLVLKEFIRLDTETGLFYYRARYYHAELGRFISRDPIGYQGSPFNPYEYVSASPLLFTDPLGLAKTKIKIERNYHTNPTWEWLWAEEGYNSNDFGQWAGQATGYFNGGNYDGEGIAWNWAYSRVTFRGRSVCNTITGCISGNGGEFQASLMADCAGVYEILALTEITLTQTYPPGNTIVNSANAYFVLANGTKLTELSLVSATTAKKHDARVTKIYVSISKTMKSHPSGYFRGNPKKFLAYQLAMRNQVSKSTNTSVGYYKTLKVKYLGPSDRVSIPQSSYHVK